MAHKSFSVFKSIVIGGVFFIIPIGLILIGISKALQFLRPIANILAIRLPYKVYSGITLAFLVELMLFILLCFAAGLFHQTTTGKKFINWLEANLLSNIPGYSFMKNAGESIAGIDIKNLQEVVLVGGEGEWELGFVTEKLQNELYAVFIPDTPNPWEGSLKFVNHEKIKKTTLTTKEALSIIKNMGVNSNKFLKNIE